MEETEVNAPELRTETGLTANPTSFNTVLEALAGLISQKKEIKGIKIMN